ncbi:ABC transporter ATP-binding protein [Halotalea alkalilenta]|uniref:ABC transporter ATP-binding protein n=1 Tax=Halotalea alkalilenta TaxID=376489 RepID=UPI00048830AE|nr:ABC transporter ATP-binding protein [Halotalea alkalilenta]
MSEFEHDRAQRATLEASGIAMDYGHRRVIERLDLRLPEGKVTAIVGPNGCGKSTLLAGLARLHAPSAGVILLDGEPIYSLAPRDVARRLALLPQEANAPDGLTVLELVQFGRQPHQGWLRQWSEEDQRVLDAAIRAADLVELADRPLESMSGGQRQRAWLAMAIAQTTPLLLLDEPTSALDLGHQIEVFELIRSLSEEGGKTVVMVVHDLVSACRYADHLVAMLDGRIVAEGTPTEVVTPELVRELYGIDCRLVIDPLSNSPILTEIRRCRS